MSLFKYLLTDSPSYYDIPSTYRGTNSISGFFKTLSANKEEKVKQKKEAKAYEDAITRINSLPTVEWKYSWGVLPDLPDEYTDFEIRKKFSQYEEYVREEALKDKDFASKIKDKYIPEDIDISEDDELSELKKQAQELQKRIEALENK